MSSPTLGCALWRQEAQPKTLERVAVGHNIGEERLQAWRDRTRPLTGKKTAVKGTRVLGTRQGSVAVATAPNVTFTLRFLMKATLVHHFFYLSLGLHVMARRPHGQQAQPTVDDMRDPSRDRKEVNRRCGPGVQRSALDNGTLPSIEYLRPTASRPSVEYSISLGKRSMPSATTPPNSALTELSFLRRVPSHDGRPDRPLTTCQPSCDPSKESSVLESRYRRRE